MATILEILKYIIPALVVLLACYLIVQKFLVAQTQRKQLALFHDSQDVTLRLRLQAYERLVLFVERISPRFILQRIYDSSMTVADFQYALTFTINSEFEHNLSQQIYVSQGVWETVKNVKEQELNMVNRIAQTLNPEASAKDLHGRIMEYVLTVDGQLPTEVASIIINQEVRKLLAYGPVE